MSTNDTNRVMGAYFEALGTGHFQQFLTDDATWTTVQTGEDIRGAIAVEDAINGLHARMTDLRTQQLVVADGAAYLEGTCADPNGADRIPYCVAYDLAGDRIVAMRAYGELAAFMPPSS